MQNLLKIGLFLSFLYDTLQQTCNVKNTEYNLLYISTGESLRLPLNDYFSGDGLQYSVTANAPFTIKQQPYGYGTFLTTYTPIDITSQQLNGNQNIQTLQYFALVSTGGAGALTYNVLQSKVATNSFTSVNFQDFFTVDSGICYQIDSLQGQLLITCSIAGTNALQYYLYNSLTGVSIQTESYPNITIAKGATVVTETSGAYIITMVNDGSVVNNTYASTSSAVYVFYISENQQLMYEIPFTSLLAQEGDYYTGISVQQGILFVTTFYTGANIFQLNGLNAITQITKNQPFNPFNIGTLGVASFNFDYSQNYYYAAIVGLQGIVTFVYNINQYVQLTSEQVFQSEQVSESNMFQTQVFLNSRYIVVSNLNGISVYPSIINDINDGQLLYYFNSAIISSGFDYYNNIMISLNQTNALSFQFNNPIIYNPDPFIIPSYANLDVNFTITATTSQYTTQANNKKTCQITLYYAVMPNSSVFINYTNIQNYSNTVYSQEGQQFDMNFGSMSLVNINKMLTGPAIIASSPTTKPAISKEFTFSNILDTPQLRSPYGINQNIIAGQTIIYSQIFYDPTFILNTNTQYKDSYYELVQIKDYIVLYQCQGLKNEACLEIASIPEKQTIVEGFALSFSGSQIIIAYYCNQQNNITRKNIGYGNVYVLTSPYLPGSQQNRSFSVSNDTESSIVDIALINENFYLLYQAASDEFISTQYQDLIAVNALGFVSGTIEISEQVPVQFSVDDLYLVGFTYNVPAYGNILFVNSYTVTGINQYNYYLSTVNFNYNSNTFVEISTVLMNTNTTQYQLDYQLTMDGIYVINSQTIQILFYPRVDIIPYIFITNYSQTPSPNLPFKAIYLPTYQISAIISASASARFLYVTVQEVTQYQNQIYVYRNSQTVLNSLYYIIPSSNQDMIEKQQISVVSALQYDAILFKSQGSSGYRNAYLMPEFEFLVKCNLASNAQYQVSYNYVGFKASNQLTSSQVPADASQFWASFQITNLVSFVREISTSSTTVNGEPLQLNSFGQQTVDPRYFFTGNAQGYLLSTSQDQSNSYTFSLISPVVSQPQTTNYMYPITSVSTVMSIGTTPTSSTWDYTQDSYRNQYWCTFVQTNRLVYVTPYVYYNPPTDFVDNSTIKIDYPLIYKLPVLDIGPNSQNCPLIFVDPESQGVVSVCGTKVNGKFLASFTLFDTTSQVVLETQIINLIEAFPNSQLSNNADASYSLLSGSYLQSGVVVLQYRYQYNFGTSPPTDFIFSFIYTAKTQKLVIEGKNNYTYYQLIQPIPQVYQINNQNIANLFSVTPFQITTDYLGQDGVYPITFGLICVTDSDVEECLTSTSNAVASSGIIITAVPGTGLGGFLAGSNITITYNTVNPAILGKTSSFVFSISILNTLAMQTQYSIQKVIPAGIPMYEFNSAISSVPLIAVSKGTAYVFKLQFYLSNGQYIQSQYSCSLQGLTDQNQMLQVSATGTAAGYSVVAIVSNPNLQSNNQVTLLNYGVINNFCKGLSSTGTETSNPDNEYVVTAIGSYTYQSVEANAILSLMVPPSTEANVVPRTLISNNQVIQLLDTSAGIVFQAYPNYNIQGGVTLNLTQNASIANQLFAQVTSQSITTYISNTQIKGGEGSSLFQFGITSAPSDATGPWNRKLWGQFIWGSIMFIIIIGVLGWLFYKSQPQAYNSL